MVTFSPLTTSTSGNGGQFSSRNGAAIDHVVVHHAATTSLSGVLSMMSTGSREVSANYVIKDEQIVGVVPEESRAWTSGSASWDGRSITVETCNSVAGEPWPISPASHSSLARLIADCATRYGFPINRDTVVGHRELYTRYGASYATACPGGINLDRLVADARAIQQGNAPTGQEEGFLMALSDKEQIELRDKIRGIADGSLPQVPGYPFGYAATILNNQNATTDAIMALGKTGGVDPAALGAAIAAAILPALTAALGDGVQGGTTAKEIADELAKRLTA